MYEAAHFAYYPPMGWPGREQHVEPAKSDSGDTTTRQSHSDDQAVLQALTSGQLMTPAAVAQALRTHPQLRATIMMEVQQRFGNAFAQQVMTAESSAALLQGPAPTADPTPDIVKNGAKLGDAAERYLSDVSSVLVPYTRARDALDAPSVADIGRGALGSLQLVSAALTAIDQQLTRARPIAANCGPGTDPLAEMEQAGNLAHLEALRSRKNLLQVQSDSLNMAVLSTFTPLTFRGQPIPDVAMNALEVDKTGHLDASRTATAEWQQTYQLLQVLETFGKTFASPAAKHDPGKLMEARMELRRIAGRPRDLAFMRQALMGTGLWNDLNNNEVQSPLSGLPHIGAKEPGPLDIGVCTDDGPLTELYKETKQRAVETGWSNNVGGWDQDMMFRFIRMGGTEAYMAAYNQIMSAEPDGRAAILHQLEKAGLFDRMFTGLPWKYTKEIHDGLPHGHGDLKSKLQPHFLTADKWGTNLAVQEEHTPSVHQMIDNASDNVGGIGGAVIGGLNHVYNFLTLGFARGYGETQDAYHEGTISDDDHDRALRQVQTRTVIGMAFMMATAGTMRAAQMAPLPNLMAGGAPSAAQVGVTAGVEGATWATAELGMLDIGDMASGAKTQASSLPDYLLTMLLAGGATAGSALLAHYLGGRAAKYLDPNQRSRGQALAVENPQLTPVVDKLRGVAPGSTVRVRLNADEAYALREAGLIDAQTHRALRDQFKNMPEVEVDVKVIRGLDEPAPTRAPDAKPPIHDAPSLTVENVGPLTGSIPAPDRVAIAPTPLAKSLPAGAKIVDMEGDQWVRYEMPDGSERIRFRAEGASVSTPEPKPGRNHSPQTRATVMSDRSVGATEGVHRMVGSAQGDVIPSDVGGVRQQPGVLDYEYRQMDFTPDEMHKAKSLTIDYNEPDVPVGETRAQRQKKGWE